MAFGLPRCPTSKHSKTMKRIDPENETSGTTRRGWLKRIAAIIVAPRFAKAVAQKMYPVTPPWPPILSTVNMLFEQDASKITGLIAREGWPAGPAQKAIRDFANGVPIPDGMGYNFKAINHS